MLSFSYSVIEIALDDGLKKGIQFGRVCMYMYVRPKCIFWTMFTLNLVLHVYYTDTFWDSNGFKLL